MFDDKNSSNKKLIDKKKNSLKILEDILKLILLINENTQKCI